MNNSHQLSKEAISPEVYQRCLWALTVAGIVLIFFFLSWLSIQRAEILLARRRTREAEQQTAAAWQEHAKAVNDLNERLSKTEAARATAERELRETVRMGTSVHTESAGARDATMPARPSDPNAQELASFVRAHLTRMTVSVEAQLTDYADEVDFHEKPHATLRMIESDRRMWAQRYPVRAIFTDEVQPQFSALRDTEHGWVATAIFNWRWEFRSRSGAVLHGLTRDTWKIVPSNAGLRIIAEHSADPATGQPRD